MSRIPISLIDLHYFVVVAEDENLHSASRKLGVAQPALSRRIRNLEEILGVVLFYRANQRIRLSPIGQDFLNHARRMLDQFDQMIQRTRMLATGEDGWISVGLTEFAIRDPIVKALIRAFAKKYPGVMADYRQMNNTPMRERLSVGELDLAFITSLSNKSISVPHLRVSRHELVGVFPKDFKTVRPGEICLRDFEGQDLVLFHPKIAPDITTAIKRIFASAGVSVRFKAMSLSEPGRLHFVSAGLGTTIVSALSANEHNHDNVVGPIVDLGVGVDMFAIWTSQNTNPSLPVFVQELTALTQADTFGYVEETGHAARDHLDSDTHRSPFPPSKQK